MPLTDLLLFDIKNSNKVNFDNSYINWRIITVIEKILKEISNKSDYEQRYNNLHRYSFKVS